MAKVIDGNYADIQQSRGSFDTDEYFADAFERVYKDLPKTAADDESIRERSEELRQRLAQ